MIWNAIPYTSKMQLIVRFVSETRENGIIATALPVRLPLASIHTLLSTIAVIIVKKTVRTHSAVARIFPDFFSRSARGAFSVLSASDLIPEISQTIIRIPLYKPRLFYWKNKISPETYHYHIWGFQHLFHVR